jgi:RimJ/RimL family protein N-acetyltransferase
MPDRFVLHDGRGVCVRHLRPADRAMYRDAVAGLSPRSRYLRFAAPMPMMSESLLDQMMDFDGDRHVVYAALTPDETTIVGVARFVRTGGDPYSAEIAIAIADDWQRGGLGAALLARLVERAREANMHRLVATTLSENHAAVRLALAVEFCLTKRAGIYAEYELPLGEGPNDAN